jgi:hypothetical protein
MLVAHKPRRRFLFKIIVSTDHKELLLDVAILKVSIDQVRLKFGGEPILQSISAGTHYWFVPCLK